MEREIDKENIIMKRRTIKFRKRIGIITSLIILFAITGITLAQPTANISSTIYVGSHGSGVWKTTNGGSSWQVITDSLPIMGIAAIAIDPSNSSRVYVATPDYGLFRSEDGGASWVQLDPNWKPGNVKLRLTDCCDTLLVNPNNPDELHLTSLDGVYRSTDRGLTWSISLSTPGQDVTSLVRNSSNADTLH